MYIWYLSGAPGRRSKGVRGVNRLFRDDNRCIYTCKTGVHRCKYGNEGVYRVYIGCLRGVLGVYVVYIHV